MSNFASALTLIVASAIGGFTQDCLDICSPETIFMPEVPTPIVSHESPKPSNQASWIQNAAQFEDRSY